MPKEFLWTIMLTQTDRIQKHPCYVENVDHIPQMYLTINTGGQVQVASPFRMSYTRQGKPTTSYFWKTMTSNIHHPAENVMAVCPVEFPDDILDILEQLPDHTAGLKRSTLWQFARKNKNKP